MKQIFDLVRREPARVMALVKAALVMIATFVPRLSVEQREAVMAFVAVLIVLLGEGTRAMSTPNARLTPPAEPQP